MKKEADCDRPSVILLHTPLTSDFLKGIEEEPLLFIYQRTLDNLFKKLNGMELNQTFSVYSVQFPIGPKKVIFFAKGLPDNSFLVVMAKEDNTPDFSFVTSVAGRLKPYGTTSNANVGKFWKEFLLQARTKLEQKLQEVEEDC